MLGRLQRAVCMAPASVDHGIPLLVPYAVFARLLLLQSPKRLFGIGTDPLPFTTQADSDGELGSRGQA